VDLHRSDVVTAREMGARARKVRALVALVPEASRRAENEALAKTLQNFDDSQRRRWSEAATGSTRAPSDLTWFLFVQAVRERLTGEDVARGAA
jgi:hypothetical protein